MELNFRDGFFETEEIDGFVVEEEMKRAWAAQLVVLSDFDDVCKKYGLTWFADYGTLLGAVRHKGYIPWDDDIDISMPRKDYNIFVKKAFRDLPKGYYVMNINEIPTYTDFLTRIVNHPNIDFSKEALDKYYGCPYACGIDITVIDYIPREPNEYELFRELIRITGSGAISYEDENVPYEDKKNLIKQIEKMLKVKFDRGRPIPQQMRQLCDRICSMYNDEDADNVGVALRQTTIPGFYQSKESVFELIELPFECIKIPAPRGYDEYLTKRYGANYMTPRQVLSHDYPFYKAQKEILEKQMQ